MARVGHAASWVGADDLSGILRARRLDMGGRQRLSADCKIRLRVGEQPVQYWHTVRRARRYLNCRRNRAVPSARNASP
ncbi:MAG: hypothetical protein ACOVK7_00100, partial [Burkholderiaceae bacterium]